MNLDWRFCTSTLRGRQKFSYTTKLTSILKACLAVTTTSDAILPSEAAKVIGTPSHVDLALAVEQLEAPGKDSTYGNSNPLGHAESALV